MKHLDFLKCFHLNYALVNKLLLFFFLVQNPRVLSVLDVFVYLFHGKLSHAGAFLEGLDFIINVELKLVHVKLDLLNQDQIELFNSFNVISSINKLVPFQTLEIFPLLKHVTLYVLCLVEAETVLENVYIVSHVLIPGFLNLLLSSN